jgi:butyryl-CoA dehydrogenase
MSQSTYYFNDIKSGIMLFNPHEIPFQIYECLATSELTKTEAFGEHDIGTFNDVIRTAETIAKEYFAPHNHTADSNEPKFDGERVHMLDEVKTAYQHYADAGFIAAKFPFEIGGMQLPETITTACASYFMAANPSTTAYPFLTSAAANVIAHCACESLQALFLEPMLTGRFSGTMALTEPHAGSSLAEVTTSAYHTEDGSYRIKGSKLYISGGEHELTENIVHLVLAKIPGGPDGVKGISLFIVPKYRQDEQGAWSMRNDVTLAGLIHKLGYRGTTSTALTFGENGDCHGYLVGEPHQGLRYMFMMMNEARIGVGFGAAMIGYQGYRYALDYAKDRIQGGQAIVEYGDVKRMLLAQKAYTEGAMALCFYGASLLDEQKTCSPEQGKDVALLLDLLTPIIKAWPSEYGPKANDLAIQVLGGAGYTREYPVEQYWRDNRLNPIHEGTNGIQALDLLGRKLWQGNGAACQLLSDRIIQDIHSAKGDVSQKLAKELASAITQLGEGLPILGQMLQSEQQGALLSNADNLMKYFGHLVIGWMWLRQANVAYAEINNAQGDKRDFYQGKIQAAQYYTDWEMPAMQQAWTLLITANSTCEHTQVSYF